MNMEALAHRGKQGRLPMEFDSGFIETPSPASCHQVVALKNRMFCFRLASNDLMNDAWLGQTVDEARIEPHRLFTAPHFHNQGMHP
ncbi:MAG TPA: hypothetical protein ENN39_11905 [Desulfonatronum sp.]|nr:hypothetical protein [Desulfonatronum sp.]